MACHCGLDPQSMPALCLLLTMEDATWIPDQVRDDIRRDMLIKLASRP
jgi:hypothetical protein